MPVYRVPVVSFSDNEHGIGTRVFSLRAGDHFVIAAVKIQAVHAHSGDSNCLERSVIGPFRLVHLHIGTLDGFRFHNQFSGVEGDVIVFRCQPFGCDHINTDVVILLIGIVKDQSAGQHAVRGFRVISYEAGIVRAVVRRCVPVDNRLRPRRDRQLRLFDLCDGAAGVAAVILRVTRGLEPDIIGSRVGPHGDLLAPAGRRRSVFIADGVPHRSPLRGSPGAQLPGSAGIVQFLSDGLGKDPGF